ncbi:hypothetical protein ACIQXI_00770 [Lysinibacillus sp. NPDC097195]|uniref:hypothetical protein n=1 Tax=Lysinibacillus sp. NPDC097195 TaxID=3364141 RepID=UPI0037FBEB69
MTLELHNTENPLSNAERLKLNENWQRIMTGYSYLQQQIKVLAGGAEVDELIQRLNEAVDSANIAVLEAIEANDVALQEALTTVAQTLVDVNKAIGDASTATTEANAAKQGALDATAQAQTALTSMQSLITNLGSKGVWNVDTQYYKNNMAVFNGSTFIAMQDNLGKTPPTLPTQSNAYWSLFAEQGARGPQGLQGLPGKDGKDGTGVNIIGELMSEDNLPPTGSPGDAYMIAGDLYVWQENTSGWKNVGPIRGPQGKSAYDLAVENGFIGTMEEWIESLKGIQGPQGPVGPPGPPADLTEINQQVGEFKTAFAEHTSGIATTEKPGHIKPDGETILVDPVTGVAKAIVSAKRFTGDLNDLILTGLYLVTKESTNKPWANYELLVEVKLSADGKTAWQYARTIIGAGTNQAIVVKRNGKRANVDVPFTWTATASSVDGYFESWVVSEPVVSSALDSTSTTSVASSKAAKLLNDKIEDLKSSVSSGKALVANAITGKGVSTSPTAEFATMASNISAIQTGKRVMKSNVASNASMRSFLVPATSAGSTQYFVDLNLGFQAETIVVFGSNGSTQYESTYNTYQQYYPNTVKLATYNGQTGSYQTFQFNILDLGNGNYSIPVLRANQNYFFVAYEK